MNDITAEKRLELIRTIRAENSKNRMNMQNRQSILYGYPYDDSVKTAEYRMTQTSQRVSATGIRILFAIILFSLFIVWDYSNLNLFSLNTTQIYEYLQENYTLNSFAFIEEITYTFTHGL